jgi:precorrin isomerase
LPRKFRKRKQRVVVDTNVVVAGISGFRNQYVPGRVASADLMYSWAEEEHFTWSTPKTSLRSTKKSSGAYMAPKARTMDLAKLEGMRLVLLNRRAE